MLGQATEVAKRSDVVIAFVGLSPSLEGEEMPVEIAGFKGGDRTSLDLPQPQQKLLEALSATGKPPIVYAAAGARLDIVQRLLALKIDINARYANDLTVLMWAAGPDPSVPEAEAIKLVSYLLDGGAQVDDKDNRGRTALMITAEGGHAGIADLLLARGADPSLEDKAGKRAADLTVVSELRQRLVPR